tara:strand:+ start:1008 stop:1829 length:822 start_codon:yes stop_codon:yes gene_type:complete
VAFLTVNGIPIPVEDASAGFDVDLVGRARRSITGLGDGSFLTSKRAFKLATPVVDRSSFLAYQGLLNGEGHVIPLQENCSTADGVGASKGTATFTATADKFDGGDYYMTTAGWVLWSAEDVGYNSSTGYTICWVSSASPSGHSIFAITATGESISGADLVYRDGSSTSLTTPFYNIQVYVSGILAQPLFGTTEEKQIHEIVYLPFKLTASQMETITTRTKRFSALPYIAISGDMVDGETVTCAGTSGKSDFVPSSFSGAFGANNKLSFTLQEK